LRLPYAALIIAEESPKYVRLHLETIKPTDIVSSHRHAFPCRYATCSFAEPAPNSAAGHKIAQQYCAECHVIAPYGKRGWTDAPAFDAIAKQRGTTAQTLITFIQRPHMHMVNTGRPPEEAADIAAYILTLRKH
jgi:hypothetical protein